MGDGHKFASLCILVVFIALAVILFVNSSYKEVGLSPQGVEYSSNNLVTTYSAGEKIKGTVNVSFESVFGESVLSSNFDGEITLIEFLEANNLDSGGEYNCSTPSCVNDFSPQEEITSLSIDGDGEIAGFEVTGADIFPITSVELTLNSNAGAGCFPQLFVDVLNDGEFIMTNSNQDNEVCNTVYQGCFEDSGAGDVLIAQNDLYCERIELPAAPGFELSANIKNSTNNGELKMRLYKFNDLGDYVSECTLPEHQDENPGAYEELSCIANYSSATQEEYFVCVTSLGSETDYKIKFDTQDACGTNSNNFGAEIADYDIFAKSLRFGSINGFNIHDNFMETYNFELADYVGDYVSEQYQGNCQQGCAIPIRFWGIDQELQFSGAEIVYVAQQGTTPDNKFYSLEIEEFKIDSEELELDLEKADFIIPLTSQEDVFEFYIDNELVFEESISVSEGFDFSVSPGFVAFGQNVLFSIESDFEIVSSDWDFGDGGIDSAEDNEINHRYLQEGSFEMTVSAERSDGVISTKSFTVIVGDAEQIANLTIEDYEDRLDKLDKDLDNYPEWIGNELNEQLDPESLESILNSIKNDYEIAASDEEFQEIMIKLIDLRIPTAIEVTKRGDGLPLLLGFDNIDISYIEDISADTIVNDEILRNNIGAWMSDNLDAKISFEKINGFYDDGAEVILSKFRIETNPKNDIEDITYLIIGLDVEADGKFMSNYGQNRVSGGTSITLEPGSTNRVFEFYLLGDFDPTELGAYVSPVIDRLGDFDDDDFSPCNFNDICEEDRGEDANNCEADCSAGRWPWFVIWIVVLAFAALVVYIVLQEWYKKYYEGHLFKNKNNLYNLIYFIYNSRKSGIIDQKIKSRLTEAGWKGERINYAFNKIDGKRTGMYEIPLLKFVENKKVKNELEKRQKGRSIDPRFVRTRTNRFKQRRRRF